MTHILEADSIQLQFGERRVLQSVYLKCETGRITGLLGRNGEGKSCLLEIIYGSRLQEKSLRFDSVPVTAAYRRPDLLRYLPQFRFIPGFLTMKKVFEDFQIEYGAFEKQFSGFTGAYKKRMSDLPGGDQRLVELYVIVKSPSQFCLLDEPFSHLDPIRLAEARQLLLEAKERKGILVTDHMYRHILDVCDNLYVLTRGTTYLTKSVADLERLGYARIQTPASL
jgi:ABC-type lipopolysaccharide export system ATPase subunit